MSSKAAKLAAAAASSSNVSEPVQNGDHHKWKMCPSNRDKVELYYMVMNGIATVHCIEPLLAKDCSMKLPLHQNKIEGREEVLKALKNWLDTFSPYKISQCVLEEGPAAFVETAVWHATGRQVKEIAGIAPTSKRVFIHGGTQFVFNKKGHIQHIHTHFDGQDLVKQLSQAHEVADNEY